MRKHPDILFEDDHIVIINKTPGLLSIPDRYKKDIPSAYDILCRIYGSVFTVHRIDKETSGCLLFAKNAESHKLCNQLFETRKIIKTYHALVHGRLNPTSGIIDVGISHSGRSGSKMKIDPKGKSSITQYELDQQFTSYAWVKITPLTGRTHQIRVHMGSIGHALCGDSIYGKTNALYLSSIKGKKYRYSKNSEERPILSRCALHASSLEFVHPIDGNTILVQAPLSKDLKATINQMLKWSL